jgi:NAD(P)-dependent dehydrogenase (short-subunit alcohol dehydrogenase family)
MELKGKAAVVTGGASGIGRALARRFSAEEARGVVVADLDGPGAGAVAEELEGPAIGVWCDVTAESDLADLIEAAEKAFGPVDLFCANAGIADGAGLEASREQWDTAFAVHVRSHAAAARLLLPGWLERGEGYFLSTASAAGLLCELGSVTYTATKHATVAFAEWLAITYGDRGVKVSCLCPLGVRTRMLEQGLREGAPGARIVAGSGPLLEPDEVAEHVVRALADERFLILPHPEVQTFEERKAADRDRWLDGMRRMRAAHF